MVTNEHGKTLLCASQILGNTKTNVIKLVVENILHNLHMYNTIQHTHSLLHNHLR